MQISVYESAHFWYNGLTPYGWREHTNKEINQMSIFKLDTIIQTFPAMDIVTRKPTSEGYINVTVEDELDFNGYSYYMGSAVSYALEYNRCPIKSYNECLERGHKTRWVNTSGTFLSSDKKERKTLLRVNLESVYMFEGVKFRFVKAPNNNLDLEIVE